MARRDSLTGDMFLAPKPVAELPGTMDYRTAVAHLAGALLKRTPADRYEIAGRMSRLTGREISKAMLDGYTAESREEFNLPAALIAPLEVACGGHDISQWLAEVRGGRLLVGEEALLHDLARWEQRKHEADEHVRALKNHLRKKA